MANARIPQERERAAPFDRVVLPVEGGSDELLAQQAAVELAAAAGAEMLLVHVATGVEDPPEDIFAYVETMSEEAALAADRRVIHGADVLEELVSELEARDLVVIGTRALGTGDHLGSIAEGLIREAPCPVQVIRVQ